MHDLPAFDLRDHFEPNIISCAMLAAFVLSMPTWPHVDGRGHEARFSACDICTLMKELGLQDLICALWRFGYTMSELDRRTTFVREHTLAEGGPYCDCGYIDRKKQ